MKLFYALIFLFTIGNAFAAAPPTASLSGQDMTISATDNVTTGFDIYLDNNYFMSVDSSSSITLSLSGQTWCSATAAAWAGGGTNHSMMSNIITNPNCGSSGTTPIGFTAGICVDSTATEQSTGIVLATWQQCF